MRHGTVDVEGGAIVVELVEHEMAGVALVFEHIESVAALLLFE
jgi:hypothetical protein